MMIRNFPCVIYVTMPKIIADLQLTNDQNGMVELTKQNAQKVKAEFSKVWKDSAYELYCELVQTKPFPSFSAAEIEKLIKEISIVNSTRTSNANIRVLANYIFHNMEDFLNRLKNCDYSLVDDLTNLHGLSRKEKSLASKICRFFEEWVLGGENFTINDSVVRSVLPYYFLYYDITCPKSLDDMKYADFMMLFDALKAKLVSMTASEIDLLLWFVYKDDAVRRSIAQGIVKASANNGKLFVYCPCLASVRHSWLAKGENIIF